MKLKLFPLLIIIIFLACSDDDNPIGSTQQSLRLFGKVVDSLGVPIDSVGVHYLFEYKSGKFLKSPSSPPSTQIRYSLPHRSYVRIDIFRWFTRDSISSFINDTLNAGIHTFTVDVSTMTNGFYIYRVITNNLVQEKYFALLNTNISEVIQLNL
ncbi:MAG: hypothetical protein HY960_02955 [Ignavibacteriae bacterium]|nr:hypothetical protein [Ignavibacteriota bacterium]